jgi:RNA polymerase sigma factor (sigma-70 family)
MNGVVGEDRRILSRCFSGDRTASELFVQRFSDLVYRSVQHALRVRDIPFSRADVEDLHNTVFLELFDRDCRKLRQYEGRNGCSLASWIRLIAVRTVVNHLRKKGVDGIVSRKQRVPLDDIPELKSGEMGALGSMEKDERERLVREGIRRLSPRDRLFMKLHFDQGLPLPDVAATMQVSVRNAYIIKHRAIQKLKTAVASAADENLGV